MHPIKGSIVWLVALMVGTAMLAAPAHAQFEEPDTVGSFGVGPFVEVFFRGQRGTTNSGTEVSLTGGPGVGARLEYRLTETLTLGVTASYSSPDEQQKVSNNRTIPGVGITQLQFTGEANLRVKPNIPGYFILGGGIRRGDPESGALHSNSFSEPLGILGAGLQFISRRHWAGRLEFRGTFVSPTEQPNLNMKGLESDFSISLGGVYRP